MTLILKLENEKHKDDKIGSLENTVNTMQSQIQSLISAFSNMREQTQVDGMARTLYGSGLIKAAATTTVTPSEAAKARATAAATEVPITTSMTDSEQNNKESILSKKLAKLHIMPQLQNQPWQDRQHQKQK
jgi:hypothetical protein